MHGSNLGKWSRLAVLLAIAAGASLQGCSRGSPDPLEQGLRLYRQNKLEEALPLLEQAAKKRSDDPDVQAWLAETYRRLRKPDAAAKAARKAIDLDPCNSFAHNVLGLNYNPMYGNWPGANREMAWRHLMKAAECDSMDGNTWTAVWTESIRRGDRAQYRRALRLLMETGFLTDALLSYNRWMLRDLPENALLLTNGDWDTYPAVALQEIEGFRPDVAVANRSLLNLPWYAMYLREQYGLTLPFTDEELLALKPKIDSNGERLLVAGQIFRGWLERSASGDFSRPIAVSVTVDAEDLSPGLGDHLVLAGPFWLWRPDRPESRVDTSLVASCLAHLEPDDLSGPFVSPWDRSPIRVTTGAFLVHNVSAAALKYADLLIAAGRMTEAEKVVNWIESFEAGTELGPFSTKRLSQLRKTLQEEG